MTDHAADIQRYIDGVLDGSIVTGRLERLAVHRHLDDLKLAVDRGFVFEAKYANAAINFAAICNQFEGEYAGQPLELRLEQKFLVWCLFGWRVQATGLRRFRHVQCEVGRKWGKSTLVAYLCCLLLYADWPIENGAQGYVAATKLDQASIVWECAKNMILQSPVLKKRANVTDYNHRIFLPHLKSVFKPLAADKTPDGFNPHFIIKDEEHAWRENHRGQANTLKSGFGARSQPLTITITTYGSDESTLWLENHDYAVRILESVITGEIVNDQWFVFIAALDYPQEQPCFRCRGDECPWCDGSGVIPVDDPYDETIWRKANPGIGNDPGCTPLLDRMRDSATEARGLASQELEFFQKNLQIKVASRQRFLSPDAWDACKGELSDWRRAYRVHGAADPGVSNDMFGGAVVSRFDLVDDDGQEFKRFEIRGRAWTCEERHEAVKTPQIARWIQEGLLTECSGDQVRFSDVVEWAHEQTMLYGVLTWAYDHSWARVFGQELQERYGLTVFKFTQSHFHYNNVIGVLEALLNEVHIVDGEPVRALCHDGDPVLAWHMANMVIHRNSKGERMPDKSDPTRKIDVAVCVLMAISECLYSEASPQWIPRKGQLAL
jgi:phage terminase large subunit-like protein